MNSNWTLMIACAGAVTLGWSVPAAVAQTTAQDPIKVDNGDPPDDTPKSNAHRRVSMSNSSHFIDRAEFLVAVADLGVLNPVAEGFELLTPDNLPSAQATIITPNLLTPEMTLSGDDLETVGSEALFGVFSVPFSGAQPADGTNYVRVTGVAMAELTFDLDIPTRYFGISFSDWGDIASGQLVQIVSNSIEFVIDESPRGDGSSPTSGDKIFFGVIDDTPFTRVVIRSTAPGDGFAIDEIYFRKVGRSTDEQGDEPIQPAVYLDAFIRGDSSADLTGDGLVDFFDLSVFLSSLDR